MQAQLDLLKQILLSREDIEFAVLVGSHASGTYTAASDWDIAIQLRRESSNYLDNLARMENLRSDIGRSLGVVIDRVDLIDVPSTKLAMRENICQQGVVLTGGDSLPWFHFLQRTWRELEDYYWNELYVA